MQFKKKHVRLCVNVLMKLISTKFFNAHYESIYHLSMPKCFRHGYLSMQNSTFKLVDVSF